MAGSCYKFYISVFISILAFSTSIHAQSVKDTLQISSGGEYALNKHVYYYKDKTLRTPGFIYDSVSKNKFEALFPRKAFTAGVTGYYYWFVFTLKNNSPVDKSLFF